MMRGMRLGQALGLALVLLMAAPGRAEAPYVLGMSAAFTGQSRALGIEFYRGAMAWFDEVNRSGGINGRQVQLLALDDGYNPTPAIDNTISFIERERVLCLFGYVGTPTVTPVLPLLRSYSAWRRTTLFFPFTGAQVLRSQPNEGVVINLRASYRQELSGLVEQLLALGRKRIAVFYQADAYGRSGWEGVKRALAYHDLPIVAEATYRRGASFEDSMQAQVGIIARARPDAVICVGSYQACAAFIRDARNAGLDAPVANLSFVGAESLLGLLQGLGGQGGRDYTRDLIITQVVPFFGDPGLPAAAQYRELMDRHAPAPPLSSEAGYRPLKYSAVGFEGFLSAKVMTAILERAGADPRPVDLERVALEMRGLDVGIDAMVSFGLRKRQGLDKVYYTTVKDGAVTPVTDWGRWRL